MTRTNEKTTIVYWVKELPPPSPVMFIKKYHHIWYSAVSRLVQG